MNARKVKINFELTIDKYEDEYLYSIIQDTSINDFSTKIRELIDDGISVEFSEYAIEQRIKSAINNFKKNLYPTKNNGTDK